MDGGSAQDTIYLCNFKVSVDGEWLCLREVDEIQDKNIDSYPELKTPSPIDTHFLMRMLWTNELNKKIIICIEIILISFLSVN